MKSSISFKILIKSKIYEKKDNLQGFLFYFLKSFLNLSRQKILENSKKTAGMEI